MAVHYKCATYRYPMTVMCLFCIVHVHTHTYSMILVRFLFHITLLYVFLYGCRDLIGFCGQFCFGFCKLQFSGHHSYFRKHLSLVMRKPTFCICENKDADQPRGNREADQRLCFRYMDGTIPLLPKYKILSL